jgi:surface carbohydrate biosynthesis protein
MHKWLYIPVEVKVRELQAKLLLAKYAAANGYKVVIGRKSELLKAINWLPPGIFFGMWVPVNFKDLYKGLKDRGFYTTGLDEEGLVTFSDKIYANFRLSKETLSHVDKFFSWGEWHTSLVKEYASPRTQILNVGNLRFDLLRPELRALLNPEADKIKEKYGKIILVISSFAFSNHFSGAEKYMEAQKKSKVIQTPEDEAFFREYIALQDQNFKSYLKAIPALANAFPNYTFIIRPHPAENVQVWEECRKDFPNVFIENEGNVHAWIIASSCIIHHFCTTALEACAAEVPSISYRTFKNPAVESELPYIGSAEANNEQQLIEKLRAVTEGDNQEIIEKRNATKPLLKRHIHNIDGLLAVEQIINALEEFSFKESSLSRIRLLLFTIASSVVSYLKYIKALILTGKNQSYIDHKFSTLEKNEIEHVFKQMPMDMPGTIKKISPMCFFIEK